MGITVINGDPNQYNEKGLCVHAGINIDQPILTLAVRTQSPQGFPSSDLMREYFTPRMSGITDDQQSKSGSGRARGRCGLLEEQDVNVKQYC